MSGITGQPTIVISGLVLYLDVANRKSYISGNNIFSLNNTIITGSLKNGVGFNGNNLGSFVFDGTNDYISLGNQNLGIDLIDKSFCAWVYLGSTLANPSGVIDKDFDNGGTDYGGWGFWIQSNRKLWWWNQANQDLLDDGSNTIPTNKWTFISVTYNATSKTANFYINATLNSSKTNVSIVEKSSGTTNLVVGCIRNAAGAFLNGRISNVSVYNKVLSTGEILQNYNAAKARFGL